jgi:hypothetical protein
MIPDLTDESEMARKGRLSALYKARDETARKARDSASRMLNNLDNSSVWEPSVLADYLTEIQLLTRMINDIKDSE